MASQALLTQKLRDALPKIYATEATPMADKVAVVKFFTPDSNWTWYGVEFDGKDTFFGLVDGVERDLGYFSLSELESIRGPMGLPIERDLYFEPTPLVQLDSRLSEDVMPDHRRHPRTLSTSEERVRELLDQMEQEDEDLERSR